ncbi:MAG TPA: hypothetical protein VG738_01140 [Chitinophagaceae bacterium]|nr:hypothetical protein [Chitinophagaceae bacterium]
MKKIIFLAGLCTVIAIFLTITGCYRDIIAPPVTSASTPPQKVSFNTQIVPLLAANCAKSGCHVPGSQKPYMDSSEAYKNLVNGGFVNTIVPNQSIIYQMLNGQMGQYIPSTADIQLIYDWIRNGAPNN